MSDVIIYHNPACGTSRNTLALLREHGVEPKVVEYLKVGWTSDQLTDLFAKMGVGPGEALRVMGTRAQADGLTAKSADPATIIAAMVADPILVNRPIVASAKGAALCRPAERALDLI